jgi:hypothetical protein
MKLQEFRKLIREEIRRTLKEASPVDKGNQLGFDESKVKSYKVGAGNRAGMPIAVNKLQPVLAKSQANTVEQLQRVGVTFDKAYVNVRPIGKSYRGQGSGMAMSWTMFGTDSEGNEIILDKYEGGTAGGGQLLVFVNGKKTQASFYVQEHSAQGKLADELSKYSKPVEVYAPRDEIKGDVVSIEGRKTGSEGRMREALSKLKTNRTKIKQAVNRIAPFVTELYAYIEYDNDRVKNYGKNSAYKFHIKSKKPSEISPQDIVKLV